MQIDPQVPPRLAESEFWGQPSNCVSTWPPGNSWAVKSGHQWSSCYISTVLSYCRVFQQQHYWHFGLASPLLWGAVLRIVECKRHPRIRAASFASTHWMTAATPHPGMTIPNVYSSCQMPHGGGKIAPGWETLSREMLQNVKEEYMERFFFNILISFILRNHKVQPTRSHIR